MDLGQENPISAHFYLRLIVCRLSEEVDKLFCRRGEIWCDCRGLGEGISKTCEGCMSWLTAVTAEQNPKQQRKVEPWNTCLYDHVLRRSVEVSLESILFHFSHFDFSGLQALSFSWKQKFKSIKVFFFFPIAPLLKVTGCLTVTSVVPMIRFVVVSDPKNVWFMFNLPFSLVH